MGSGQAIVDLLSGSVDLNFESPPNVLPHLKSEDYPAWSLSCALYLEAGIRGVEIGSVMFGKRLDDGTETYHRMELVRLAFPRRVYTQAHFDYILESMEEVVAKKDAIRGMRIVEEPPFLRHFTARFAPLA